MGAAEAKKLSIVQSHIVDNNRGAIIFKLRKMNSPVAAESDFGRRRHLASLPPKSEKMGFQQCLVASFCVPPKYFYYRLL